MEVISKAGYFILLIALGYFLKKIKLLKRSDADILGKIVANVTLPCVFFASASRITVSTDMIGYMGIGLMANVSMVLIAYVFSKKRSSIMKGTYMIACSGYDVGNFVLPFVTAFLTNEAVWYLTSFNVASILMCMGITYALACSLAQVDSGFTLQRFGRNLLKSLSFDVYLVILILGMLQIRIPEAAVNLADNIGSANTFLVMVMIGLKIDLRMKGPEWKDTLQILGIRLAGALVLTALTWLLPIPRLAKVVLAMIYFGPLTSVSSIYAKEAGYEGNVVANANILSIFLSIAVSSICILWLL